MTLPHSDGFVGFYQWVPRRSCGWCSWEGASETTREGLGLTHITVGHDDQLKSRMYIRGSGTKSRWSHSRMSGSMKKRHTEERTLRTRRGVASRMSLRHLPTNAGQGRPAEFSGAVAANHGIAFGAQEQSHGWGAAPGIAAGQTIPGSCASASSFFSSARAGPSHRACSSFFGRWSSAKKMTASSFISTGIPYADRTHP